LWGNKEDLLNDVFDVDGCEEVIRFKNKGDLKRHRESLHQLPANKRVQKELVSSLFFVVVCGFSFYRCAHHHFQEEKVRERTIEGRNRAFETKEHLS